MRRLKAESWARQGVELRQGDLTGAQALTSALEGVEGAFIMQPTPTAVSKDFPEARAVNTSVLEALRHAPPP